MTATRRSVIASGAAGGILAAAGFSPILVETVDHRTAMMAEIKAHYGTSMYGGVGKVIIEINRRLIFGYPSVIDAAKRVSLTDVGFNDNGVVRRWISDGICMNDLDVCTIVGVSLDKVVESIAASIAFTHARYGGRDLKIRPYIPVAMRLLAQVSRTSNWRLDFTTSFIVERAVEA